MYRRSCPESQAQTLRDGTEGPVFGAVRGAGHSDAEIITHGAMNIATNRIGKSTDVEIDFPILLRPGKSRVPTCSRGNRSRGWRQVSEALSVPKSRSGTHVIHVTSMPRGLLQPNGSINGVFEGARHMKKPPRGG